MRLKTYPKLNKSRRMVMAYLKKLTKKLVFCQFGSYQKAYLTGEWSYLHPTVSIHDCVSAWPTENLFPIKMMELVTYLHLDWTEGQKIEREIENFILKIHFFIFLKITLVIGLLNVDKKIYIYI